MRDSRYDNTFLFFQEDGHKYNDSNGNSYKSVTTLIHDNYVPKFDVDLWARKKARELGKSVKEIKESWANITKEACNRGIITHNGIEDAIKNVSMFERAIQYLTKIESGRVVSVADIPNIQVKKLDIDKFIKATDNKYPEIYRVFKYYLDNGYTIYSEICVFLIDYLISGTIDILCIRDTDFVILDWKTNRNGLQFDAGYFRKDKTTKPHQLTNDYVIKKENMLPPLAHLPNCNGSHYTMQLSTYARMTELVLGIPCTNLGLCHIGNPFVKNKYGMPLLTANGTYPIDENGKDTVKWYQIKYRKHEADAIFADRLRQVKAEQAKAEAERLKVQPRLFD